tara:strand:- start:2754 stop:3059 length:306 start_codon:yes stop_codon:yes gene_type:complete
MKMVQKNAADCKRINKYKTFKEMPSWMLCGFGGPSLIVSYFFAKHVVVPAADEIVVIANQHGFDVIGTALSVFVLAIGVFSLAFGAIATRCGQLLFQRHFA